MDLKIGQYLYNKNINKIAKVIVVSNKWGWFIAAYLDGHKRRYENLDAASLTFRKLTDTERADFILDLESRGITDSWQDT